MAHEPALALAPVDQQVLAEEHGRDHAQAVVHPAGFPQLPHRRIDDRKTGAALLPSLQLVGRAAPRQRFGLGAEGAVHRDPRVADQDVLVELTPEQLVDPVVAPALPLSSSPRLLATAACDTGGWR